MNGEKLKYCIKVDSSGKIIAMKGSSNKPSSLTFVVK